MNKKRKLVIVFLVPVVLISIFVIINLIDAWWWRSPIFMNRPTGIIPVCLDEGKNREVSCDKNNDCFWEAMRAFCGPSDVRPSALKNNTETIAILNCPSTIKCSPDKVCEHYCH